MRNGFAKLTAFAAAAMATMPAHAVLPTVWQTASTAGHAYNPDGGVVRGLDRNPSTGNVLVARTIPGIAVVDAGTGVQSGSMVVTGVSGGGGAHLTKVKVADFGVNGYDVYGINLVTSISGTNNFTIYRWTSASAASAESTLTAPVKIYEGRVGTGVVGPALPAPPGTEVHRLGDVVDIAVSGNTVTFYVPRAGIAALALDDVYKFTYTRGDAAVSAVNVLNLTGAAVSTALRGLAVDKDTGKIIMSTANEMAQYDADGTNRVPFANPLLLGNSMISWGKVNGVTLLGGVDANTATFSRTSISNISNGVALTSQVDFTARITTPVANTNATGDVVFDDANDRVYALATNNSVGAYTLSATGGTKTWDGGAASTNWNDAANWAPDGVPTGFDNVVLDNSTVAGNYTVELPWSKDSASVKSLIVGDSSSGNAITLSIPALATAPTVRNDIQLNIAGAMTAATDTFVIRNGGIVVNSSNNGGGNIFENRSAGNQTRMMAGSLYKHDTARGFAGPFPTTGDGLVIHDTGSTVEYMNPSGNSLSMTGRAYANLALFSTAAKTYTSTGGTAASVNGILTIGPTVTYNVTMTGGWSVGSIVNNGAGSLGNTGGTAGIVFTDAAASVSGSGSTLAFPNGAVITPGNSLKLEGQNINGNVMSNGLFDAASTGRVVGTITQAVAAATTYPLPIGTATANRHTSLNFTSAPSLAGTITASFVASDPTKVGLPLVDDSETLENVATEGYWNLAAATLSGGTYDMSIGINGFVNLTDIGKIRIVKRVDASSPWTLDGNAGVNSGTTVVRTGMSGFSHFAAAAPSGQLPVSVSGFSID